MILANEQVSEFFSEKKIPFLYRVHEKPEETSIEELKNTLNSKWIFFDEKNINPLLISQIIDNLEGKPDKYFLSKRILQAMAKAKYMDEALWHFWLSLKYYSHFTSPIRRYPDLQIHRIIKEYIDNELTKNKQDKYKRILKKIREYKNVDINRMAEMTKVSKTYIQKIEQEDVTNLPALVYVRGFVYQYAKCLKLNPDLVATSYLEHLKSINPIR